MSLFRQLLVVILLGSSAHCCDGTEAQLEAALTFVEDYVRAEQDVRHLLAFVNGELSDRIDFDAFFGRLQRLQLPLTIGVANGIQTNFSFEFVTTMNRDDNMAIVVARNGRDELIGQVIQAMTHRRQVPTVFVFVEEEVEKESKEESKEEMKNESREESKDESKKESKEMSKEESKDESKKESKKESKVESNYKSMEEEEEEESEERLRFFELLWRKQMRNPLLVTPSAHFYTMDPYPRLRVLNVDGREGVARFPPPFVRDMLGYAITVPMQLDLPQTFIYLEADGRPTLSGLGGTIFQTLMDRLNVTVRRYRLPPNGSESLDIGQVVALIASERIEISPHLTKPVIPTGAAGVELSYPYITTKRCFILPLEHQVSRRLYLLKPLSWPVWLLIGVFVAAFALIWRVLHRVQASLVPGQVAAGAPSDGFFVALAMMLATATPEPVRERNRRSLHWFFLLRIALCKHLIAFGCLTVSQVYSTALTSLLAVTLHERPHATFGSILAAAAATTPILTDDIHLQLIQEFFDLSPEQAARSIRLADIDAFTAHRNGLDRAYVYPISELRWLFLSQQQQRLRRKRFWFSDVCLGLFPLQFHLRIDSHFYRPLMYHVLWARESGLYAHWKSQCFWRAATMGYVQFLLDSEVAAEDEDDDPVGPDGRQRPLTMELLGTIFQITLYGYVLCTLVFVAEQVWRRLQER